MQHWGNSKKDAIESILIDVWSSIGMDIPANYEEIVNYCYDDVSVAADPHHWHEGDVIIAFRRWIESKSI